MRWCREGSTSSISFQPWLLPNSCSLFIYFHISLVTQAAAHSFNPCTAWATLPGAVTAQAGPPKLSPQPGHSPSSAVLLGAASAPIPDSAGAGKSICTPRAGSAGQAAIPAVFVPASHQALSFPSEHSPTERVLGQRVPQTAQAGHSRAPLADPFVHFLSSFSAPAAQFVFWLTKPSQTPWLISTKEE